MFPESPQSTEPSTILSLKHFFLLTHTDLTTAIKLASSHCTDPEIPSLEKRNDLLWAQNKIFVPLEVRPLILKTFHDHKMAGHFGMQKTSKLISHSFWWPGWRRDCKNYVASCISCQGQVLGAAEASAHSRTAMGGSLHGLYC